jgi:hypothetical protein
MLFRIGLLICFLVAGCGGGDKGAQGGGGSGAYVPPTNPSKSPPKTIAPSP